MRICTTLLPTSLLFLIAAATPHARPPVFIEPPSATADRVAAPYGLLQLLPTLPPMYQLAPRADEEQSTLTIDSLTCGFQNGKMDTAYVCFVTTRTCANDGTHLGCCDPGSACLDTFITSCIDSQAAEAGACEGKGSRTLCCTTSQRGFCHIFTTGSLTGHACGGSASHTTGFIQPTPNDWPGVIVTDVPKNNTATPRPTDEEVFPIKTELPDSDPLGTGEGQTKADATEVADEDKRPSSGSIIGGVFGAVLVVAIVSVVVLLYMRKKRKQDEKDLTPSPAPPLIYCSPESMASAPGSDYAGYRAESYYYPPLSSQRSSVIIPSSSVTPPASSQPPST